MKAPKESARVKPRTLAVASCPLPGRSACEGPGAAGLGGLLARLAWPRGPVGGAPGRRARRLRGAGPGGRVRAGPAPRHVRPRARRVGSWSAPVGGGSWRQGLPGLTMATATATATSVAAGARPASGAEPAGGPPGAAAALELWLSE